MGVLYLSGNGQMALTHMGTGQETVVDVKPGRFLSWDNAAFTHRLVGGETARRMVGPMTVKDGVFHAVAWNPLVYGQLALSSLLVKPGGRITAKCTFLVRQWNATEDLSTSRKGR